MTTLDDLFDLVDLEQAIAAGYVRTQVHPTLPLTIFNYSELAQFDRHWTPVTGQCRGLVAHSATGEVVARPFPKTHNWDEPEAPTFGDDEPVIVADKIDGSLGIGYPGGHGYSIATRGSFASEQAVHATDVYRTRYEAITTIPAGITPLWEIVYPDNRIVVDYGRTDDLVLLGGVEIASGEFIAPGAMASLMRWTGPVTETFPYRTFAEMVAAPEREGKEGYVVRSAITGQAAKWKYPRYVELHRLVTGMNERVIWEHLGAGKPLDELIAPLPDEFHGWVRGVADRLVGERDAIVEGTALEHADVVAELPDGWTRRDYAEAIADNPLRPWLFLLLDGRDPAPKVWRTLRPSGAVTMTASGEDVA